ncbi:unspecified product [Plasmodium ovale wallikeri]|uniref:Unspecified product n=1 Tax=Plasmodium ovale wallikeri TaxID=864142 RepID=A0A1A9A8X2_PLAOA|nr:unspecified product [Plasmodium ovale wallikeri]SBT55589.1 unspecified product [Plasmodium ovale wallikeri]
MASIPGRTDIFPSYFEINEQCSFQKFKETFPDVIYPCGDTFGSAAPQDIKSEETCTPSESAPRPEEESLTEKKAENTLNNYPSIGIFLSSAITHLVAILLFFILYRFTPLGSQLFNRLKKQNILL